MNCALSSVEFGKLTSLLVGSTMTIEQALGKIEHEEVEDAAAYLSWDTLSNIDQCIFLCKYCGWWFEMCECADDEDDCCKECENDNE